MKFVRCSYFYISHRIYLTRLKSLLPFVFLSCLYSTFLNAQDPVFSQFYLSPLQLNPGLSGLTEDPRFSANYRNQYPGFNNAYRTYALSYDQFFPSIKGGLGFWLLSDDGCARSHGPGGGLRALSIGHVRPLIGRRYRTHQLPKIISGARETGTALNPGGSSRTCFPA